MTLERRSDWGLAALQTEQADASTKGCVVEPYKQRDTHVEVDVVEPTAVDPADKGVTFLES